MNLAICVASLIAAMGPYAARADDAEATKAKPAFELRDGDRVVFLGNTLVERMVRYGHVEAALTARWPDRNVTYRNLGWSGDTVWAESRGLFDPPAKGYERMLKHVGELKPTVIFLGYGNVEAFAGEQGLPAFVKQYEKLLDDLTKVSAEGVRFVLLGPKTHRASDGGGLQPVREIGDPSHVNANIEAYHKATAEIAGRRGGRFIDLRTVGDIEVPAVGFTPFSTAIAIADVSYDGQHWNERGYSLAALAIARQLDADSGRLEFEWTDELIRTTSGRLESLKNSNGGYTFDFTRATTGAIRTQMTVKGIPRRQRISLRIDGQHFKTDPSLHQGEDDALSLQWEHGVDFLHESHPDAERFEALRRAIVEKNRLYFLKWRPQNVTYLTLFRKHEQGNNAAELAEFDELVAEKEAEIAKLRKPVKRTYELIRVEGE